MENGWKLNITNIVIIPALIHQVKHTHMQTHRPIYCNILAKTWVWLSRLLEVDTWANASTVVVETQRKKPIHRKNRQETRTQGGTQRKHMACTHGYCC